MGSSEYVAGVNCPRDIKQPSWLRRLFGAKQPTSSPDCTGPEIIYEAGAVESGCGLAYSSATLVGRRVCCQEITSEIREKSNALQAEVTKREVAANRAADEAWATMTKEQRQAVVDAPACFFV